MHFLGKDEILSSHDGIFSQYIPVNAAPHSLEMQYSVTMFDVCAGPDLGQLNQVRGHFCISSYSEFGGGGRVGNEF